MSDASESHKHPSAGRKGTQWTWFVVELLLFLGLAVAATWPLATSLQHDVPLGTEKTSTVPLFNAWTIWWNADRLAHGYADYWDAPIFHPTRRTFALSEPLVPSVIGAPVIWARGGAALAYNSLLLLALALNGLSVRYLLRRVGLSRLSSLAGGVCATMLPFVHWQLGVWQLVPLFGVVWTIHALYVFGLKPSIRQGVLLGVAFALTYLLCCNIGLFLSVLLIAAAGWLVGPRLHRGRAWLGLIAALLACGILTAPIVFTQLQVRDSDDCDFSRTTKLMQRLSARSSNYLAAAWPDLLPAGQRWVDADAKRFPLSPGSIKMLLAIVGIGFGVSGRGRRGWTGFCVTVAVVAFVLSLGPAFAIGRWSPYRLLIDWYPGFSQIRSVVRFALFVQLAIVFLAAFGLEAIVALSDGVIKRRERRMDLLTTSLARTQAENSVTTVATPSDQISTAASNARSRWIHASGVVVCLIGLLAAVEIWPAPQQLVTVPSRETHQRWLDWICGNTAEDAVLACVPFPKGKKVEDYRQTGEFMYLQTYHHRPMVNGYSGFFPETFLELKPLMARFPNLRALDELECLGVEYCIILRSAISRETVERHPSAKDRLTWVFGDDVAGVDIYHLEVSDAFWRMP